MSASPQLARVQARVPGPCATRLGRGALALAAALVGVGLGLPAAVVAAPPVAAGSPEQGDDAKAASDEPVAEPIVLLTLEVGEDAALGPALVRAITTELNDLEVRLELRSEAVREGGDGHRLERREAMIRADAAAGLVAIAIDERGLVIELVVADAGMLRRPPIDLDAPEVAIEAAAVIVRHFVVDLISGRPLALTPGEPPGPDPSAAPEPAPTRTPSVRDAGLDADPPSGPREPTLADRGRLRVQLAYLGQAWLRERAWDNGVELGLGWRFAVGAHVGLAAGFGQAFEAELVHPDNRGVAQLRVRRYPIAVTAGYQQVWTRPRLALDAQLRVGVEVLERGVFDPAAITPRLDRPVIAIPTVEPRLAFEYLAIGPLALFVAVGARASLIRVDYRVEYVDAEGAVVARERPLAPRTIAPVVVAGLDMFF